MRAFLMICVVAGHLLEIISFQYSRALYVVLYSFHMPAFAYVSGYCCKLDSCTPKRLLCSVVYPYVVFQTLYLLFANYVLHAPTAWQYTTPYWLLWYLLSLLLWTGMLALVQNIRYRILVFAGALALSLAAGYDKTIGYYASLSRTFTLFPFFLGGHYVKLMPKKYKVLPPASRIAAASVGAVLLYLLVHSSDRITNFMLYHSYAYTEEFTVVHRAAMLGIAWSWIAVLLILAPRRRLPWLTYCGRNTMTVFLFHGFIVRFLSQRIRTQNNAFLIFLTLLLSIPVLLSAPVFVKLTQPLRQLRFSRKKRQAFQQNFDKNMNC